jgi:leader peptidase (prepilin peptidase)/N-methyltransferase
VDVLSTLSDSPRTLGFLALAAAGSGLLLGSFLNVCIARLPHHASIVRPGSHCPRCAAPIRPWQNIPLLSYALLRGRCRQCRERISWRYPAVEAALAALLVLCVLRMPTLVAAADAGVLCFLLLGLLCMDAETFRLPDTFTLPGIVLGIAQSWLPGGGLVPALDLARSAPFACPAWSPLVSSIAGAGLAGGVLYAIRALYFALRRREGMGMGDVKLAAMLGAWMGVSGAALSLMLGILAAAVWSASRMRIGPGRNGWQARLPLGAFLCAGGLGTLFAGENILRWYFHFWR